MAKERDRAWGYQLNKVKRLELRLSEEQLQAIAAAADRAGQCVATWVRRVAMEKANPKVLVIDDEENM